MKYTKKINRREYKVTEKTVKSYRKGKAVSAYFIKL
jgi:hypothetical protein